jgi:hypothetical protein
MNSYEGLIVLGAFITLIFMISIELIILLLLTELRPAQFINNVEVLVPILDHLKTISNVNPETSASLESLETEIKRSFSQVVDDARNWRLITISTAAKAAATLQNCWMEKSNNSSAGTIYEELLTSLKTVGVSEFLPKDGDVISLEDSRYDIQEVQGVAPFRVSEVLAPGYLLSRPKSIKSDEMASIVIAKAFINAIGVTD